MAYTVAAFYCFKTLACLQDLQAAALEICDTRNICGTLLIAPEGYNGTIAGEDTRLREALKELDGLFGFDKAEIKFSHAEGRPFKRLKIRLKKEIITLRAPEANPALCAGKPVPATEWNALIARPDVVTLDTRNDYEVASGRFEGAVDPHLQTFGDFTAYAATLDKTRPVAMYCTGGIRCEKASSYLLHLGFSEVYQLQGGILKYLEIVPKEQSRWQGSCFVFDERNALSHGLEETVR